MKKWLAIETLLPQLLVQLIIICKQLQNFLNNLSHMNRITYFNQINLY